MTEISLFWLGSVEVRVASREEERCCPEETTGER
jgi:hypothetical protein